MNSIEKITMLAFSNGYIYICGEYWCDPEHGFSIIIPNEYSFNYEECELGSSMD